jgi:hypothetical protein
LPVKTLEPVVAYEPEKALVITGEPFEVIGPVVLMLPEIIWLPLSVIDPVTLIEPVTLIDPVIPSEPESVGMCVYFYLLN